MKISILIAYRKEGNETSNIERCLESLRNTANNPDNYEILIKCDDDDIHEVLGARCISTPRASGYADLHKYYMDLFAIASPESELFWVLSDDVEIKMQDWDVALLDIAKQHIGKPYVINTATIFNMLTTNKNEAINGADSYPLWSRNWLAIAGFGYVWATDGWTSILAHTLENDFGIMVNDYRYFVYIRPYRYPEDSIDESLPKWKLRKQQRDKMFETLGSPQMQSIIQLKAAALAREIRS